jgi:hypothetical protein
MARGERGIEWERVAGTVLDGGTVVRWYGGTVVRWYGGTVERWNELSCDEMATLAIE